MNGSGIQVEGIYLSILALFLAGGVLIGNRWIKKVTNTYWFWLGISIFYITYCITMCWATYWNRFAHTILVDPTTNPDESNLISRAFMLNVCPFLNFMLPVALIADPSRRAARAFAPFATVTSLMVILVALPMTPDVEFSWWGIFVGNDNQSDLFFFGHTMNLLISLGIILNTPKLGWKGGITVAAGVLGFYLYVIIVAYSLGVRWKVSGIFLNDFGTTEDGAKGTFYYFEKVFGHNYRAAQAVFFISLISFLIGTVVLCDLCKRGWFVYGDKYSGCWWHWYDYEKTTIKEPWGWFSHKWQLNHHHLRK